MIRLNKYFLAVSFLFLFINGNGSETTQHYDDLFSKANEHYINGEYENALKIYVGIENTGLTSHKLYYNTANTYYKLKIIPEAIYYYEKSLKLKPGDEDALFNLEIANTLITDKIEKLPQLGITTFFASIRSKFSANQWAWFFVMGLLMFSLLCAVFIFTNSSRIKRISFASGVLILGFAVITIIFAIKSKNLSENSNYAIIFEPSLTVMSEPSSNSTELFVVHEGTKLQLLESNNEWQKIKLNNGNQGWVPMEVFRKI